MWSPTFRRAAALLLVLGLAPAAPAAAAPKIVDATADFYPREVNDSGTMVGYRDVGFLRQSAATWTEAGGVRELGKLARHHNSDGWDINNAGVAVGDTFLERVGSEQFERVRGTRWAPGGAAQDLGGGNAPAQSGESSSRTIDEAGVPGGTAPVCDDQRGCIQSPARGNPLAPFGPQPPEVNNGGSVDDSSPGGVIGYYNGSVLFNGSAAPTHLHFNPRRILSDGRIVGDRFGSDGGGTVIRGSDGALTAVPCGDIVLDANDAGDILAFDGSRQVIWHGGECFPLDELVPQGAPPYAFRSQGASTSSPSINAHGQVATRAFKTGEPDEIAVLLTPEYPMTVQLLSTPSGTPGEFDFEAKVTRGRGTGVTTTWDFGDGTTDTGAKVRKRYTRPGTFTVTGKVRRTEDDVERTVTRVVEVPAPTLQLGVSLPGHEQGQLPFGAVVEVVVDVGASAGGVGDLSELTFQGGTFTTSPGGILEYTTAATAPFSLSPGSGNTYPLKVRTAGAGRVTLDSLIVGKDAAGRNVSARVTRQAEVAAAPPGEPGNPGPPLTPPGGPTPPLTPPGGSPVTPPVTPPTTFGSKAAVGSKLGRVSGGRVSVTLDNDNAFAVVARVRLLAAKGKRALGGARTVQLPAGTDASAKVRLKRRIARKVRSGRRVAARLVVVLSTPSGDRRTLTKRVKLRR